MPLNREDLAILALESPDIAGHSCKVVHLGADAPGLPQLRQRIAERLDLAPALARRLGTGPDGAPAWVPDPEFEVAEHVVAHHHDGPLDWLGLRRCVARLFEQRLDRTRPLWRMDVVELERGELALVWRIHHALADGTTMMRFARSLLWDEPPDARMTRAGTIAQHVADDRRRRRHLAGYLRRELAISRSRSPFDAPICERREVAFASVPLRATHEAAKAIDGASVNDAVLSILAGALRHWIQVHHGRLDPIRVKVPVSLHHARDAEGNRDSMFFLGLPLAEADPVARLRVIHGRTTVRKEARDAERREVLMHRISAVSPRLRRFVEQLDRSPRRFALNVSNVPGPRHPVRVLTSPVRALYSLAEISRHHALRVAVVSLADQLSFGFCVDPDIVPDVQTIATRIEAEARALRDALVRV